jgi:tRNA(Ile)-lysidine synthase
MADSRKKRPDLLEDLMEQWPDVLSGHCSIEVGLSGGLDSMVLLDVLWRCREARHFHLSAVHVHHGLSPNAEAWVAHCQHWCAMRSIPLRVERVSVALKGGDSLEAVARDERYAVYRRSAAQAIALAHHQDDQAETVLLQLLRGGGAHALAAMPALRRLGEKWLWRPMLLWPRTRLEAYAAQRALTWVTDESNADTRWRRNLLRHDILPLIESAMPDYRQHLQRSAAQMWQAAQILDEVAAQDLDACGGNGRLHLSRFVTLSAARQSQVLVHWLKRLGWNDAAPEAIETFRRQVLEAGVDRHPELRLPQGVLFRYRDQVWAHKEQPDAPPLRQFLAWPLVQSDLPRWGGVLSFVESAKGISSDWLEAGFEVRPRVGGERLQLEIGNKPVKTLLQEAGIPPAIRKRWPLLYLPDGRLAAVPSVAVALDCRGVNGHWPMWQPG